MVSSNDHIIVKNTIFLYVRMFFVLGISLYTTRAFLKILGIEDVGIYNVVGSFVSVFAFFSTMISNATLRFYNYAIGSKGEEGITEVYNISVILQFVFFAIVFILLETVGLLYINYIMVIPEERMSAANWLFQFSIISLFVEMMNVPNKASILSHERMGYFAFVSVLDAVLNLAIVFALTVAHIDQLILFGFLKLCIVTIDFILNFGFCRIHYKHMKLNFKVNKSLFREMFGFLGWNTFGTFSNMIKDQGVNMVLNLFFGPVINAARGFTMQISGALQQFVSNNNVAVAPQVVKSYAQGDIQRSVSLMLTVSKINFILFFVVALPVSLEIDYILNIWLDHNVPESTSIFTILIFCCYIINNWNAPLSNLVYATGKMRNYQLLGVIHILLIPLCYVAFKFGLPAYWAFILMFFTSVANHFAGLYVVCKMVPLTISFYIRKIVIPSLCVFAISILPPLAIRLSLDESFTRLCICTLVSVICVCLSSYMIILTKSEQQFIKKKILTKFIKA